MHLWLWSISSISPPPRHRSVFKFSLATAPSRCNADKPDESRPPGTRPEWTLTAQIAWMNTPPLTFGILLGCQWQTCLWCKRVVSFFTNKGMSNCLVRRDNFFAVSPDTHGLFCSSSAGFYPLPARLSPTRMSRIPEHVPSIQFPLRKLWRPPPNSSAIIRQHFLADGHTRTTPSSEIPAPASTDVARTKVFVTDPAYTRSEVGRISGTLGFSTAVVVPAPI